MFLKFVQGDWGTQFGMLIAHLKDTHPNFLQDPPAIGDLQAFYKESKKRFDEEDGFKSRAHAEVVKLQSGDADCLSAWRLFCDVSRKEFEKLYSRLDVHLTERGESFYNPIMPGMVEEFMQRGLVRESDGAQCFFVQGKEVPLMIRKRDGGFTYDTVYFPFRPFAFISKIVI
jgi:arginyl-tRNA synthetase